MTVDKELLFKRRLPEDDVVVHGIPGVDKVRVRALSRLEVLAVQNAKGLAATERKILSCGLVDPVLTEAEVGQWQEASPAGELEPVCDRIAEMSGMKPGAAKEAYKSVRG